MTKALNEVLTTMCIAAVSIGLILFQIGHREDVLEIQAEIQLLQGKVIRLEMIARELTK